VFFQAPQRGFAAARRPGVPVPVAGHRSPMGRRRITRWSSGMSMFRNHGEPRELC
jgi:hypothetical protein